MFITNKDARLLSQEPGGPFLRGEQAADDALPQHSLIHSVWLHLLPGILIVLFAIAAGFIASKVGLPLLLVPSLWVLLVLIPLELGYLLVQGKKRNGTFSLQGIVLYRKPLSVKWYLFLVPTLVMWAMIAFLVLAPSAQAFLFNTLFFWVPSWFVSLFTPVTTNGHPPTILIVTVLLYLLTNPAAALVEELYFRGYLLPRMASPRGWAPLVNTILFCLYHLHSPWQLPGRLLGFLPVAYTVAWKKNIYVGIITHCVLDLLSAAALLVLLYH